MVDILISACTFTHERFNYGTKPFLFKNRSIYLEQAFYGIIDNNKGN